MMEQREIKPPTFLALTHSNQIHMNSVREDSNNRLQPIFPLQTLSQDQFQTIAPTP